MRHVYGPVPSRRLGRSLGVDPIPPKTCNWNCVYCQLGRTSPVTNTRRDYFPPDEIVAQVSASLQAHSPGEIDWITFVGAGEPTLHASLGRMIRDVKALCSIPVAVISNGSLLYRQEVCEELKAADAVLASLDAGSGALYRAINRPHPDIRFHRFIDGLTTFSQEYSGSLWLEVMLIKGLNDDELTLREVAAVVGQIEPDEVHITVPVRPPAEYWVAPASEEGLMRAIAILGESAKILHPATGEFHLSGNDNVIDAVIDIISRHPMREVELFRLLNRWPPGRVATALGKLAVSGRAQVVVRYGQRFWSASGGKYGELPSPRSYPPRHPNGTEARRPSGPLKGKVSREK
jgi:wyosine [tRNA(Phe)-imidazoG37] synthetase (radical SAM superfamily)